MPFTKGHKINLGKHWKMSDLGREKIRQRRIGSKASKVTREKISEANKGSKSYSWKGGITELKKQKRKLCKICGNLKELITRGSRYCYNCNHLKCLQCGKNFLIKPKANKIKKYCSLKCYNFSQKGKEMPWKLGHKWISEHKKGVFVICGFCKNQTYKYPRTIRKNYKAMFCNRNCFIQWTKSSSNPGWKGDNYPENKRLRNSLEYKKWRKSVWERDNYACQLCGEGKYITADHIKSWAMYPQLRFKLSNGRTLCRNCHSKTDTWGVKAKFQKIYSNLEAAETS